MGRPKRLHARPERNCLLGPIQLGLHCQANGILLGQAAKLSQSGNKGGCCIVFDVQRHANSPKISGYL
jgi:hypothetical protein